MPSRWRGRFRCARASPRGAPIETAGAVRVQHVAWTPPTRRAPALESGIRRGSWHRAPMKRGTGGGPRRDRAACSRTRVRRDSRPGARTGDPTRSPPRLPPAQRSRIRSGYRSTGEPPHAHRPRAHALGTRLPRAGRAQSARALPAGPCGDSRREQRCSSSPCAIGTVACLAPRASARRTPTAPRWNSRCSRMLRAAQPSVAPPARRRPTPEPPR